MEEKKEEKSKCTSRCCINRDNRHIWLKMLATGVRVKRASQMLVCMGSTGISGGTHAPGIQIHSTGTQGCMPLGHINSWCTEMLVQTSKPGIETGIQGGNPTTTPVQERSSETMKEGNYKKKPQKECLDCVSLCNGQWYCVVCCRRPNRLKTVYYLRKRTWISTASDTLCQGLNTVRDIKQTKPNMQYKTNPVCNQIEVETKQKLQHWTILKVT